MGVLAAACGSDEGFDGPPEAATGPAVADARFDGLFAVNTMIIEGRSETLAGPVVFEIDAEFGALAIETGCGTLLGSFTLLDGGRAGMTIAGRSTQTCDQEAENQVVRLLSALGRVDAWVDNGSGFDLTSFGDDTIELLG